MPPSRNKQFSLLSPNPVKRLKQGRAIFAEGRLNQGVITMLDPADIPNGALKRGKNINVRFDRTSRRFGTTLLTPAKPDSNPVLGLFFFKLKNGNGYTFRVTPDTLHFRGASSWTAITGAGLNGTALDRFEFANVNDTVIFANNGADPIQALNLVAGTYAQLGNAPAYRYITGFYDRALGAALRGSNEVQVGWSGQGNITVWDAASDETAGNAPIMESPSDLSDYITGIFGFTNTAVLLRERSIWLITKKPAPSDPFNFYSVFPGIGCDAPNSVAVIPNGLAWLDTRTATVWAYIPGGNPEPIGRNVEATILRGLDDPSNCFASYAGKAAEYTVCIKRAASNIVTTWTYNFRTKAWSEGEYVDITSIDDIELASGTLVSSLMIDDLVGMIDGLVGTIDQLVASGTSVSVANTRVFGRSTGDILIEQDGLDTDNGTTFETLIDSKVFSIPKDDLQVLELTIEFHKRATGGLEIYWSKDGGTTFELYRAVADSDLLLQKSSIVTTFGPLKARDYVWRVRATAGSFEILSYEIVIAKAAPSRTEL